MLNPTHESMFNHLKEAESILTYIQSTLYDETLKQQLTQVKAHIYQVMWVYKQEYDELLEVKRIEKLTKTELEEVYQKAEAFNEIVNEFYYQLQNLESWDTLDQKDCQTLRKILEDNIKQI